MKNSPGDNVVGGRSTMCDAAAETGIRPRGSNAWWLYLGVVGLMAPVYFILPGVFAKAMLYLVFSAGLVAALAVGIRRNRPEPRLAWRCLLVGAVLYTAADCFFFPLSVSKQVLPFPSFVDGIFLTAYGFIVVGLGLIIRQRNRKRAGVLVDAVVIALGAGVVAWVFIMAPSVLSSQLSPLARGVSGAYPAADVLLMGAAAALGLSPGRRRPALWLLMAYIASQMTGDVVYGLASLKGTFSINSPAFAPWMISMACLGAAALHPSMSTLSQAAGDRDPERGRGEGHLRLVALGVGALVAPAMGVIVEWRKIPVGQYVIDLVAGAVFVLVLLRVSGLMRDVAAGRRLEAQLASARDEALIASRLKSDFVATMSHEIRTPMNGVIGLTSLLLQTELDKTQRQYALGVQSSGESLLGIINDILDFSKIEAGKLELEVVDFDLPQAVEDVADLVAEPARAKGIELVAYCRPEVPPGLRGDAGRLRQILLNLVSNAVKFTERGEVVLRTMLAAETAAGPDGQVLVRFEVVDTGIGIDPGQTDRLFEAFSQADASTTRRFGGTGLGLAISRRLTVAMGGTIGVRSVPGRGSTFWVEIPFELRGQAEAPTAIIGHSLQGLRAIVVDDNKTNLLALRSQLTTWGMEVEVEEDAASALDRLRKANLEKSPYAVALLDLAMPDMDGIELAEAMKADPALATIPLMLLSSMPVEANATKAFVARLTKPIRLSQLYDHLVRAVGGATMPTPAPQPLHVTRLRGHVLVVEDVTTNQIVAKGILASLGYSCDVVADGLEALEAVGRRTYDAVLMDCHMPRMDGYEATGEIRRRELGVRHTPIIAMTAAARVEDHNQCLAAGMDDFVSKPVTAKAVQTALARCVHQPSPKLPETRGYPQQVAEIPESERRIDQDRLDILRGLGPTDGWGLLPALIRNFVQEGPVWLTSVREAVLAHDGPLLERCAHRLKGAANNVGAQRVGGLCDDLELVGRSGVGVSAPLLDLLAAEFDRTLDALSDVVAAAP